MSVKYSRQAIKFLKKQDSLTVLRITSAINSLPEGDVIKLKGFSNKYRLRVGDFRIIFDKDGNIISIVKIDNRGQVYKD